MKWSLSAKQLIDQIPDLPKSISKLKGVFLVIHHCSVMPVLKSELFILSMQKLSQPIRLSRTPAHCSNSWRPSGRICRLKIAPLLTAALSGQPWPNATYRGPPIHRRLMTPVTQISHSQPTPLENGPASRTWSPRSWVTRIWGSSQAPANLERGAMPSRARDAN